MGNRCSFAYAYKYTHKIRASKTFRRIKLGREKICLLRKEKFVQ